MSVTTKTNTTDNTNNANYPNGGLGGSGVSSKSRRSGEATSAAVLNHPFEITEITRSRRLLLGPPEPHRETPLFTALSAENATLPSTRRG